MPLSISNLKKTYTGPDGVSVPIISIAELKLGDGEHVALIGTSGSGKTTLLHLVAGIVVPDAGQIVFDFDGCGRTNIAALSEAARDAFRGRHIGYVFQTHHLLPGLTALENVLLGMTFTGAAMTRFGPGACSWKLDWRIACITSPRSSLSDSSNALLLPALASRPRLVLADEPTGALDSRNAQQVLQLIRTLCGEVNAALLLVSHDLNIAQQLPRMLTLSDLSHVK